MQNSRAIYRLIPARFRVISGSALKMVAVFSMLIDHTGYAILYPLYLARQYPFGFDREQMWIFYRVFRSVGRIAFPVYCFLLVEALFYTRSRLRYLLSLFVFALISEFPFDLAFNTFGQDGRTAVFPVPFKEQTLQVVRSQNVFFTLAIGFGAIWAIHATFSFAVRKIEAYRASHPGQSDQSFSLPYYMIAALTSFLIIYAACLVASIFYTDYSYRGILLIVILYLLRRIRPLQLAASYFYIGNLAYMQGRFDITAWHSTFWSFPGFLLMLFYNDRRGFIRGRWKYLFYVFYPLHLVLLYLIRMRLL